jgi:hypothetical protein
VRNESLGPAGGNNSKELNRRAQREQRGSSTRGKSRLGSLRGFQTLIQLRLQGCDSNAGMPIEPLPRAVARRAPACHSAFQQVAFTHERTDSDITGSL